MPIQKVKVRNIDVTSMSEQFQSVIGQNRYIEIVQVEEAVSDTTFYYVYDYSLNEAIQLQNGLEESEIHGGTLKAEYMYQASEDDDNTDAHILQILSDLLTA